MLRLSTTSLKSLSTVRISEEGSVYHGRIDTSRIIKGWQRPIQRRVAWANGAVLVISLVGICLARMIE